MDGITRRRSYNEKSPFELMASRTAGSRRLPAVPIYGRSEEMMACSDPGAKRTAENPLRVRLPFDFDRADIPYVPSRSATSDTRAAALMFSTRMTAMEQARTHQGDARQPSPTMIEGLPWTEYHAMFDQRLRDGERALERISGRAVDTSNEPDIYPDPCLLSAGGQKTHTGRLDPLTEKCDNARAAGIDRGRTGKNEAAGPRRDEFHIINVSQPIHL